MGFDSGELAMHNFSVNDDWFEVAKLILQLTLLVLAAKEVNSFLDSVTLHKFIIRQSNLI